MCVVCSKNARDFNILLLNNQNLSPQEAIFWWLKEKRPQLTWHQNGAHSNIPKTLRDILIIVTINRYIVTNNDAEYF